MTDGRAEGNPEGLRAVPSAAARAPLPLDPASVPELGIAFQAALEDGCAQLGLLLTDGQRAAFDAHARLLLAWNEHINLTAIRDPERVALLHVVDSLTAIAVFRGGTRQLALLDLGSGGGYPGIPLAVAGAAGRVVLLDSVGKKVRFLQAAGSAAMAALGTAGEAAPEIAARHGRAEEIARERDGREAWDVVTARAVGSLAEVAELALPLLRLGGRLVAWKRDEGGRGTLPDEIGAAREIIAATGGGDPDVAAIAVRGLEDHRLVTIRKVARTPGRYPRPPAERRRPC